MALNVMLAPHGVLYDSDPIVFDGAAVLGVSSFGKSLEEGDPLPSVAAMTVTLAADTGLAPELTPGVLFSRTGAEQLDAGQVLETQGVITSADSLYLHYDGPSRTFPAGTNFYCGTDTFVSTAAATMNYSWATIPVTWVNGIGWYNAIRQPHRAVGYRQLRRTIPVTTVPTVWVGRLVDVYLGGTIYATYRLVANPVVTRSTVTLQLAPMDAGLAVGRTTVDLPPSTAILQSSPPTSFAPFFYRPAMQINFTSTYSVGSAWMTGAGSIQLNAADWAFIGMVFPQRTAPDAIYWATFRQANNTNSGPWSLQLSSLGDTYTSASRYWTNPIVAPTHPYYSSIASGGHVIIGVGQESTTRYCAAMTYPDQGPRWTSTAPTVVPWGASTDYSPIDYRWSNGELLCGNRMCRQAGWADGGAYGAKDSPGIGILWQRNVRPDEDADLPSCADISFVISRDVGDWSPNWNTAAALMPLMVERPWYHPAAIRGSTYLTGAGYYFIRPKASALEWADSSGAYKWLGGVGSYALWRMDGSCSSMSVPVDYCDTYWVPGEKTIKVNAQLSLPASGKAEITYEEPDGYVMRAEAVLSNPVSSGSSYVYDIASVRVNGRPCLGFGQWHGHAPCYVSTATAMTNASLGEIAASVIASGDGSSGRPCDDLGDGLCQLVQGAGLSSIISISAGSLSLGGAFRFSPRETPYSDVLRAIGTICGVNFTVKPTAAGACSVWAVPAGRPRTGEAKYSIADKDIIGQPSSAPATIIYSSYAIKYGEEDGQTYRYTDWLARDIFGVDECLELDLSPILQPGVVPTKEQVADIVDSLQDRYGTARMRWTLTVPINVVGTGVELGDVFAVTSKYLAAPAGGIGVNGHLGRVVSVTYDWQRGTCALVLLAWALYGSGWNWCWEGTIASSSTTPTFTASNLWGPGPDSSRAADEAALSPLPAGTKILLLGVGPKTGSSYGGGSVGVAYAGTVTSVSGSTCVLDITSGGTPNASTRYVLLQESYAPAYAGLLTVEESRLL